MIWAWKKSKPAYDVTYKLDTDPDPVNG